MQPISLSEAASLLDGHINGNHQDNGLTINGVAFSSSTTQPGDIFVAIRGTTSDGHRFLDDAFDHGAVAAVVEDATALGTRLGIVVPNSRRALSSLAAALYGNPARALKVIGITGTNGKTTTNWMIYHILNQLGLPCLRIGTLGSELYGHAPRSGELTSPDPVAIHKLLAEARDNGAKACVIEASSHALDQARVDDIEFDAGIFTNLTRDHLDYHGTFDSYFEAKRHLFDLIVQGAAQRGKDTRAAIINIDDPYGETLAASMLEQGLRDYSFGRSGKAAIQIRHVEETPRGMQVELYLRDRKEILPVFIPLLGFHNAENGAAAVACCLALEGEPAEIVRALAAIPQVSGRLESVGGGAPRIFVDFAHTPDALERALRALRPSTQGKMWVVFGCGGDRDKGKRPEMGRIAAEGADRVVVTSDNPRTEDPVAIINDILAAGIEPALVDPDRRAAIQTVVHEAAPLDTILIAGKGHENYQILGRQKIHFSDQEIALEAYQARERAG